MKFMGHQKQELQGIRAAMHAPNADHDQEYKHRQQPHLQPQVHRHLGARGCHGKDIWFELVVQKIILGTHSDDDSPGWAIVIPHLLH